MKGHMNTDLGDIIVENEAVAQYAGLCAMECFGIVGMAVLSVKDGVVKLLKGDSISKGVNVIIEDDGVIVNYHVIVAYGVSIAAVAENLKDSVTYKLEEFLGMKVKCINIYVEGVRVLD